LLFRNGECPLLAQSRRFSMRGILSAFGGKAELNFGLLDVCL